MPEATNTREAILSRIRATNPTADAAVCTSEYQAIERAYQQSASMDRASIIRTFIERLHEYDANVTETSVDGIATAIAKILNTHSQKSTVLADNFKQQFLPADFHCVRESQITKKQLNMIEGAISECEVAIAHTGTIIIKGSRQITLLPDRYLCVVYENQVVETVPEAIAVLEKFAVEPLTFISGPSATADIEMTRIRGVHGPRILDVVLVRD